MRFLAEVLGRLRRGDVCVRATGLRGGAAAMVVARLAETEAKVGPPPILVVCADESRARGFARDVRFFLGGGDDMGQRAEFLPVSEATPYAEVAPDAEPTQRRLALLFRVAHGLGPDVLVASAESLRRRVIPRQAFEARCHHVAAGEEVGRDALAERLVEAGYERAPVVEDPGTFAVRGAVIDVFVPLYRYPARIEWDGDRACSIRLFEPATQRTLRKQADLFVHPARETIRTGGDLRAAIVHAADEAGAPSSRARELCERLDAGQAFLGAEGFVPAMHLRLESVLDYLPSGSLVVIDDPAGVVEATRADAAIAGDAFAARRGEGAIVLPPDAHYLSPDALISAVSGRRRIELRPLALEGEAAIDAGAKSLDVLAADLRLSRASDDPLGPLVARLAEWRAAGMTILAQVSMAAQAERLRALLDARGVGAPEIQVGDLGAGFVLEERVVVAEAELFGPRIHRRAARQSARAADLHDLQGGDLVVHQEHGIARYRGLVALTLAAVRGDFVHLEFAGGDKLYLPIYRLALIERYRGGDGESVPLDRLGGETFARRKRKASEDAQALAEDLLQIYAQRQAAAGHAHAQPDAMFAEFEATFPFDETLDQERAIGEVLADLQGDKPMDRLVCGDVGFGKTEVALRAAFLAAAGGKQVVVLAPTTILVEQHLRTFRERLADWPVRVEGLSRFRERAEIARTLKDLAAGKVDIVVGTHRLLSPDVRFKDLGLVIVDEEHRFGVVHKERLKKMRAEVDVLAMTATPIPRTLHLSLAGIRDLSVIATPPEDRLAVRTILARTDDATIRDAIRKELARRGQVFFVHNRVESIGDWAVKIRALVPEARVGVGHGQMSAAALEKVMLGFVAGEIDVFVTTAIIESGLDIPRANTMLIHRADTFGLAQLYQLRGRVGRGKERALCWLLVDSEALPGDARRRLDAVLRYGDLGSGFALATADLDIRGAGELLGGKQTGHIAALGFETYARILEEAVGELRGEPIRRASDPEILADLPGYIPETHVEDAGQRLDLYQRLAQASGEDDVRNIVEEMRDRYGPEPPEVVTLARLMTLKAAARALGATSLEIARGRVAIALDERTPLHAAKVAAMAARRGSPWKLTPDGRVVRALPPDEPDRLDAARRALAELATCR
ncbi:MAG: transcription-repair coupling factor [Myxococcota bacterium]